MGKKLHAQFQAPVHMTRCDYDAVFYRVFCITLLAIAFTFTIILTNVFVDIDGLLSRKEKDKHVVATEKVRTVLFRNDFTTETTYRNEMFYEETEDTYRSKRSLGESQNFLFHIENPKVKTILKQKLANLLEELDEEESLDTFKTKFTAPRKKATEVAENLKSKEEYQDPDEHNRKFKKKDGYLLHLALHNVLLQGVIGHMDLREVYKRVHDLINNFKKELHDGAGRVSGTSNSEELKAIYSYKNAKPKEGVEENFFSELVNCKDLEHQIVDEVFKKEAKKPTDDKHINKHRKGPNVLIKTFIDITAPGKEKTKMENHSNSNENVEGVIKLIYNGKNIKFSGSKDTTTSKPKPIKLKEILFSPYSEAPETTNSTKSNEITGYRKIPKSHVNKFIEEYFKRFAGKDNDSPETNNKRIKRDIKVKYENDNTTEKDKVKLPKVDDDELYVEIETHFDSKGMKGEKKKKLIRNLIQKIQKAIHSDMEDDLNKNHNSLHVKKRTQNPLEAKSKLLVTKIASPFNDVVHRQINPITKMGPFQDTYVTERSAESWKNGAADYVTDKSGETWKNRYFGPGFLNPSKSINSAELSEVDVDYSKILNINGIPQRLQKPLNIDSSDEQGNSFYDLGNMKFFVKDVDGTGFSIGFNQYVDEPPDTDTIKLFTGLENIINTYHQKYDQQNEQGAPKTEQENHEPTRDESKPDDHIVVRRSIKEKHDYHSNEYKIIFENDFLPYGSYQEIYQKPKEREQTVHVKKVKTSMPFVIDEDIFNKNLKPAEIFGLANLFQRKKRSINVKKITNLKSKMKMNRFLNTRAMSKKRIYMNKKRNKRQINKIRIIASDLPHIRRHSDENIYVVSDENVFADRAIVREVEAPQSENEEYHKGHEDQFENTPEEDITTPINIFDSRSRHNALSSKYPHIFMEEISKSKEEEFGIDNTFLFSKLFDHDQDLERNGNHIVSMDSLTRNTTELSPRIEQVLNAMAPNSNSNIKVTVKVLPKNGTGLNSGFKEVHTSINKSYNKNGLLYSSLVNVSEISKVIKINKTSPESDLSRTIKEQQDKMQFMLKQHKDHLNDQLQQLNEEKTRLESMLLNPNNTYEGMNDFVELIVPSNPNQIIRLSRDKLSEIAANSVIVNASTTFTAKPTTTEATTVKPIQPTTVAGIDRIKRTMFRSIERNENLTHEILHKIDKNTEVLETFLRKLTDTLTKQPPKEWRPIVNFDPIPNNVDGKKNGSHMSIPFVYAYQQPIPTQKDNVASVVYHGHIHTNALDQNFKKGNQPYVKADTNQTRFFIDDLENEYKVISVRNVNAPPAANNNTVV